MPSEPGIDGDWLRLHPLSLLFSVGSAARRLLLPGIVVLYWSGGSNLEFWLMLFFIPAVLTSVARFLSYRYRMGREEMIVREGIVTKNERHIPYGRIQNVDLAQNPVHRIFRVAEVRLETAGGESPEAVIRVLSLDAVERMRAKVFEQRQSEIAPESDEPTIVHRLPPREVALYGVISNQGMVVVAAALGAAWQFGALDRLDEMLDRQSLQGLSTIRFNPIGTALVVVVGLLVALVLLRILSVVLAFVRLHGFVLRRRGDDLRAEYGLLTRVSKTIPRHRIQLLSCRQTFLHRWFDRTAVQVETAGSAGEQDGVSSGRLWLAPLLQPEGLSNLVAETLPGVDLNSVRWEPIAARAWVRWFRRGLAASCVATVVGVVAFGVWGLFFALLAPGAYAHARLRARHEGYALTPEAIVYRSGWWVRRMSIVRFSKIQVLHKWQSPFDRRHRMASLSADTAGASIIAHRIEVPFLDEPVAQALEERLSNEAGLTRFDW